MVTRTWEITAEEVTHQVTVTLDSFIGTLSVKIDDETFELPPKFLTFFRGRREQFTLSGKPAILKIKLFGRITVIAEGKIYQ